MQSIPSMIFVHDDNVFLKHVIESFSSTGPVYVFVSRVPWSGEVGVWEKSVEIAEAAGATVHIGNWISESEQRQAMIAHMRGLGVSYVLIPDSDEIPEPKLLESLLGIAQSGLADRVRVRIDTYWKTTSHVVQPPEGFTPYLLLNLDACEHIHTREFSGGRELLLSREHGILHHLSYVGSDARIQKKTTTWSHKDEVVADWWNNKWLAWDRDPCLRDLHPTHPQAYRQIERRPVPKILEGIDSGRDLAEVPAVSSNWPSVSVVIPLYGGEEDIRECLESLENSKDLIYEVIVVDDVSPDNAAEQAEEFEFATVIRRKENGGFAAACNTGLEAVSGDVVLYLNSDTIMPRAGLIRLIESLMADSSTGAAGPVSNAVAYFQQIDVPISSREAIDGFATDWANLQIPDELVSMLVGFCLAMRRELASELGGFRSEFGKGTYEDNDLCYRIQRAGYQTVIARRSFVFHKGSRSLHRLDENPMALMRRNEQAFYALHRDEISSGFASHWPGERKQPIRFTPERHPDSVRSRLKERAAQADISLCMIVRDEERVIADCLSSAKDIFAETIVVDTGSVDRTKEIVLGFGAKLSEMEWPLSFAAARNESIKDAKGKWIFWMDADDVLPASSAERILDAAINAPDWVTGFVVPVQFVDGVGGDGTRVDHVKLFRNFPGVSFEGRIHEQILASLRKHGGEIQRLDAVVLHAGYDTSDSGQAKKKKRDSTLLLLDLEDRPGHPFVLFNLGMTAHYNQEHEDAVDWFRQCLDVSIPDESHVRKVFALLSGSLKALGQQENCITVLSDGLRLYPDDPELLFLRGVGYIEVARFGEARLDLERIPEGIPGHFASFDTSIQGFKKYFNLGICCGQLGDHVGERHYLIKAIESGGGHADAANALYSSAMRRRDFMICQEVVSLLERADERGELWGNCLVQLLTAQGIDVSNYMMNLQSASPHDPRIGVVWAKYLLEKGYDSEAVPILNQLRQAGIADASFYFGIRAANLQDFVSAENFFKETLSLNPGHNGAKNNLEILRRSATF